MAEKEQGLTPEEQNIRSVLILQKIQSCNRFQQEGDRVLLLWNRTEGQEPAEERFAIEDFLKAVDYYYANRNIELAVDSAMQKPDGYVDVYSPFIAGGVDRQVMVRIKNYMVPQILEFAYVLVRNDQKNVATSKDPSQKPV